MAERPSLDDIFGSAPKARPSLDEIFSAPSANPEMAQEQSLARTALDQGLQGATFGFADEIADRIGAGIAALATDESYDDLLTEARQNTKDRFAAQYEQNPVTAYGSNIAGAVGTGIAGGATKAGSTIANSLRTGNIAARVGKGALAGAASGGLYGAGAAEEGSRSEGAARGAAFGAAAGGLLPAIGAGASKVADSVAGKADDAVKQAAQLAQKYNIPLGLDQVTGSKARATARRIAERVPFGGGDKLGDMQQVAFNRAIAKSIGQEADTISDEVFDKALRDVGRQFDDVAKGRVVAVGDELNGRVAKILDDAALVAPENEMAVLRKNAALILDNVKDGQITGEKLNRIRSALTKSVKKAPPSIQEGIADLANVTVDALVKDSPELAKKLTNAKRVYKNILAVQPLAAKASDGNISPALLKNRVRAVFGERNLARGRAGELGELVKVGDLIKRDMDNSITTEKVLSIAGAPAVAGVIGGGVPGAIAGAGAGAVASRGYQALNANQNLVRRALEGGAEAAAAGGIGSIPAGATAASIARPVEQPMRQIRIPNPNIGQSLPTQSELPEDIRRDEGLRFSAYNDTEGKRTVGMGFNMDSGIAKRIWKTAGVQSAFDDVYKGKAAITPQEAEALAGASYKIAVDDAESFFPNLRKLSPGRRDAIVNLSYQLGGPSLNEFKKFKAALNDGNFRLAARELVMSDYYQQTPNRARRVIQQILQG